MQRAAGGGAALTLSNRLTHSLSHPPLRGGYRAGLSHLNRDAVIATSPQTPQAAAALLSEDDDDEEVGSLGPPLVFGFTCLVCPFLVVFSVTAKTTARKLHTARLAAPLFRSHATCSVRRCRFGFAHRLTHSLSHPPCVAAALQTMYDLYRKMRIASSSGASPVQSPCSSPLTARAAPMVPPPSTGQEVRVRSLFSILKPCHSLDPCGECTTVWVYLYFIRDNFNGGKLSLFLYTILQSFPLPFLFRSEPCASHRVRVRKHAGVREACGWVAHAQCTQPWQAQQSPMRDPPASDYDKGNSCYDGASPQHEPRPRPSPSTEVTFIPVTAEVCTLSLSGK